MFLLYDVGAIIAAAGLVMLTIISAVRNTRTLYDEERLP
jgi:hypothetical protein